MKKYVRIVLCMLGIIFIWIISKVLLYAMFTIPSDSMSPVLQSGDIVLVCKPILGARIFNVHKALNMEQTEIYRTFGLRNVEHNDILVFNNPYPNDAAKMEMHILKYYVKRCIGLPGDTLSILMGKYKVNGIQIDLGNIKSQERVARINDNCFREGSYKCFPYSPYYDWNIKFFGPLYIPSKNSEILINKDNYILYKNLIEWERRTTVKVVDSKVLLNDSIIQKYKFMKDYCFVAGDNVENSEDSRFWGLLPVDYIVGKVGIILFSKNKFTNEIRWNRFLKKIE